MKRLLLVLAAGALVWAATASGSAAPLAAPTGLHAFVYRADEGVRPDHTYALMPAFAWNPVVGARRYDVQLATSRNFSDATTLFNGEYEAPVASIQKTVPWMTGHPYALWVRVRVHDGSRTSGWSKAFGFNTAWQDVPQQMPAPQGLIRWTPIAGATAYDVWFTNALGQSVRFTSLTNVADEREFWTLHPQLANGTIYWRVRADRVVTDPSLPNGIPEVSHGPYSPVYATQVNGQTGTGAVQPIGAYSNTISTPSSVQPHQLTPGFAWTGDRDVFGNKSNVGLWRVYVFSDRQCVNPVLTGSVVGGDSWAPRNSDPFLLPADTDALALTEGGAYAGTGPQVTVSADDETVTPSESQFAPGAGSGTSADSNSGPMAFQPRLIALGDNGWPQGRYWWTVVPVGEVTVPPPPGSSSSSSSTSPSSSTPSKPQPLKVEYHDMDLPQDLCAAGQVWPFGMQSAPLTTTSETPFASGLTDSARVVSAARKLPSFQELPVVTWKPALDAQTYEVQVSPKLYPWGTVRTVNSVVPSAVLPLSRHDLGTWYYRVRGVNPNLVGPAQKLAWSKPVAIRISGDRFAIVK